MNYCLKSTFFSQKISGSFSFLSLFNFQCSVLSLRDSFKSISLSFPFVNTFFKLFSSFFALFPKSFESSLIFAHKVSSLICVPYSIILFRLCQHFLTIFFVNLALITPFWYTSPCVFVPAAGSYTISCGAFCFRCLLSICGGIV